MEWTNELTIEFLDLYEKENPIWDPKNQLHSNRNIVSDSWKKNKRLNEHTSGYQRAEEKKRITNVNISTTFGKKKGQQQIRGRYGPSV
jgi:hypothetical protein